MKKTNKKGFTIVELVIVIAVIAILSAVLIPTFSGIVKKARLSADQQAVRQMNTTLAAEEKLSDADIFLVFDALAEAGMDAKDYKALSKGMAFFWDAEENRVLMVENGVAIYPEEYKGRTNTGKWFSLTQKIEKENITLSADNKASVATAGQLVDVVEKVNAGTVVSEVNLTAAPEKTVDMMGAAFNIKEVKKDTALTITNGTIKNATAIDAERTTDAKVITSDNNGIYGLSMFPTVNGNLTLENLTIENMNMKDTNAGDCAFLVGTLGSNATLTLNNITIRNSSIIGYTSVGSLVGQIYGKIVIKGTITIENVSLQTVGGRVGTLFGMCQAAKLPNITIENGAKIIIKDSTTTSIYYNEQNTGSCEHGQLGLDGNNIKSWQIDGQGKKACSIDEGKTNRYFFNKSAFGNLNAAPANETQKAAYDKIINAITNN